MFAKFKVQRIIYSAKILLAYKTESFKAFSTNSFPKSDGKQLLKVDSLTWKSISDKKQHTCMIQNSPNKLPQIDIELEAL